MKGKQASTQSAFTVNFEHTYFTPCSSFSIVNFEHVNADWVIG